MNTQFIIDLHEMSHKEFRVAYAAPVGLTDFLWMRAHSAQAYLTLAQGHDARWESVTLYNDDHEFPITINSEGALVLTGDDVIVTGTFSVQGGIGVEGDVSAAGSLFVSASAKIRAGNGSPESAVTGNVGDMWLRLDGSTSTTLYIKTSGTGNTGWTAK